MAYLRGCQSTLNCQNRDKSYPLWQRNEKSINMNNLNLWQLMGPLYINLFLRCMKKPLVSTVKCTEGKDAHRGFKCDQSWCKLEKKFLNQTWSLIKTLHWEYIFCKLLRYLRLYETHVILVYIKVHYNKYTFHFRILTFYNIWPKNICFKSLPGLDSTGA